MQSSRASRRWPRSAGTPRAPFRAASARSWPWRWRSWSSRRCCCWTSPRPGWRRPPPRNSLKRSARSIKMACPSRWSSRTRSRRWPSRSAATSWSTGAGGNCGPPMRKAMEWVVEQVNAAGGVLGRRVQLVSEDDQTNPDAGVRAARKLIDVDRVAAIMGTWASGVTTAVAPLCWESKTFLTTVSGADSITLLPHQGYLIRTQPTGHLQATKLAEFLLTQKVKRVFVLSAQTPYALPVQKRVAEVLATGGSEVVGGVVYDREKTTFRSEIDQALKTKPDMIFVNGYTPDVTVVLKELFKAGYSGGKVAPAFAVNQKLLSSLPIEVTEGTYTWAPSPSPDSDAYKRLSKALGTRSE